MIDMKERYYKTGKVAYTETQVKQLLDSITILEDEALIQIGVSTGIRRGDVVCVQLSDVKDDLDNEVLNIKFWEHKKKRLKMVWVSGDARKVLLQHIQKLPKTKWLFPSKGDINKHICSKTAYNRLQYWAERSGVPKRPFHALRSTCIKLCKKKGWTKDQVSELTGDTIRVIEEHYETPSDEEMIELVKKRPIL